MGFDKGELRPQAVATNEHRVRPGPLRSGPLYLPDRCDAGQLDRGLCREGGLSVAAGSAVVAVLSTLVDLLGAIAPFLFTGQAVERQPGRHHRNDQRDDQQGGEERERVS